ncbi:hypothetical protein [Ralstonia solanacearum]|uniref:hypothetical protein n=1 Tax=Ralstonia solanacearum TaxID=305 RepID=UPI0023DCD19C|nr:hypothetical protein [Ralstonia solanacearum]
MGTNLALQKLYVELSTLPSQKSGVADVEFEANINVGDNDLGHASGNAEATGISKFRKISMALQGQVCGNSTWQQAVQGAGLTEDKAKEVIAGIVASALGLGGAWPAIVAGIVVALFFDEAAPLICQKWAEWNGSSDSNAYPADQVLEQPGPVLDPIHDGG